MSCIIQKRPIGIHRRSYFLIMRLKRIKRNKAKCLICGDVVESVSTHDFRTCRCGSLSVDGGLDYIRRSFKKEGCFEELTEMEDIPEIMETKEV